MNLRVSIGVLVCVLCAACGGRAGSNPTSGANLGNASGTPDFPLGLYTQCVYVTPFNTPETSIIGGGDATDTLSVAKTDGVLRLELGGDDAGLANLEGTVEFAATTSGSAVTLPDQSCMVWTGYCHPHPVGGPGSPGSPGSAEPMMIRGGSLVLDGDTLSVSLVGSVCGGQVEAQVTVSCVKGPVVGREG